MPICAIRPLRRSMFAAALTTAAMGCGESGSPAQAAPEAMHLTPSGELQTQAAAMDKSLIAAAAGAPTSSAASSLSAAAGTYSAPAGSGAPTISGMSTTGTVAMAGSNAEAAGAPSSVLRVPVRDPALHGAGVCGGVELDQFIAKAQQLRPELRDIQQLVHVDVSPGPSTVSAYLEPDGSFSLVFRRGDGDCVAGCINNEYWYIRADADCEPQQVGYYKRTDRGGANCYEESGMALWDEPRALDPQYACGANLAPQNLSGSHQLHARGVLQACARSGEAIAPVSIDKTIKLDIMQDSAQLAHATVSVHGVGHALIDERELTAEVLRRRVTVHASESNLPNNCSKHSQLDLEYDFEGLGPRKLYLMQVDTPDCSKPDDYCKGYVELSLSE